jgi:GAF domain-containing protein
MTNCKGYIKTFCRISRSIQRTFEMEEVLQLIVESAVDAMNGKACALFLKNDSGDFFMPAAQKGLSDDYIHAEPLGARKVIKKILKDGGYLAIKDATTDPRVENHEAKKAEGIASILDVPVMADSEPIGILALYTDKPRDFSVQEIEFLGCLADQGGIAIQKARFIKRKKQNSELLFSITEKLNSSLDIRKILNIMSAEIADAFNAKGITIRLMDEKEKELKLVASYGLSEKYLNKGPVSTRQLEKSLRNQWEIINDVPPGDIDYFDEKSEEDIATILSLPITVKEEVIGIMRVYCDKKREFPDDTVSLLRSLARLGGLAIQNASIYLQLKNDKEDLEKEIWTHKIWF